MHPSQMGLDECQGSPPRARDKRVWASLERDTAEVIEEQFQEALVRDPQHERHWLALLDGAVTQLDLIEAAALRGYRTHKRHTQVSLSCCQLGGWWYQVGRDRVFDVPFEQSPGQGGADTATVTDDERLHRGARRSAGRDSGARSRQGSMMAHRAATKRGPAGAAAHTTSASFNSSATLLVAAFSHANIWVHFTTIEKPDRAYIYSLKR